MFDRLSEGIYWDEAWDVIVRRGGVDDEVLWRPDAERKGRVWRVGGDLFHPELPLDELDRILSTVASNPRHLFIAATDRPELSLARLYGTSPETPQRLLAEDDALNNLWFLVRMRNQEEVDARIPATIALKNCWVADGVRWPVVGVLAEPLHGEIDLGLVNSLCVAGFGCIDWVVCGSLAGGGQKAPRRWVRSLRDQASERGIPFLFTGRGEEGHFLGAKSGSEVPPFDGEENRLHIFDHCRANLGREAFCACR